MDWKGNSGRVHACPVEVKKIRTKVRFYKPKTLGKGQLFLVSSYFIHCFDELQLATLSNRMKIPTHTNVFSLGCMAQPLGQEWQIPSKVRGVSRGQAGQVPHHPVPCDHRVRHEED